MTARKRASPGDPADPPRRHRAIRLVVGLVLVLMIAVVADQGARVVTEHRLGGRIQAAEGLASRPRVAIHGFPFLTQVVHGAYGSVGLDTSSPIVAGGIRVDDAHATLESVRVNASDALRGTVPDVPVASGKGSAVIPYASINTAVRQYGGTAGALLTVSGDRPGVARLNGPLGLTVAITAKVDGGELIITPSTSDLQSLPTQVAGVITTALAQPVPLPAFPFNIRLTSGSFQPDGLHLAAASSDSIFPVR